VYQDGSKELSEDKKLNREEICQNVLEKIEEDPDFLNSVVTCDETWLFQYDPQTKRQSMQWKTTYSPRPKMRECQNPRSRKCSSFSSIFKELL
jgi:hypothetical protein